MKNNGFLAEGCGNKFLHILSDDLGIKKTLSRERRALVSACIAEMGHVFDSIMYHTESLSADFGLRIVEKDGSESAMCGNGVRAAALLHMQRNCLSFPCTLDVDTKAGKHHVILRSADDIEVHMQPLRFWTAKLIKNRVILGADIGEPHACVFADPDSADQLFKQFGLLHTTGKIWTRKTMNFNVVSIVNKSTIKVRTFERGVHAETRACGTGATVAAHLTKWLHSDFSDVLDVHMPGGSLKIDTKYSRMTGPACIQQECELPTVELSSSSYLFPTLFSFPSLLCTFARPMQTIRNSLRKRSCKPTSLKMKS